ncbi:hypothetical protein [Legionella oakridgensis]|uniref:Uncharacterized protein n=2 Tax=Legionella oakridgensis TaxID=29423 RepID=W0B9F9_9GAMM|nr:hypothetical protein [Legionella oakridgensis]AHE66490.1 hypothetical protein Loa_00931 [Legionella oakridgensis ATCC 33761 = DSM 21215]ETO93759.1 hypothetical protein LOR_73c21050 [Legionella oakridgensis RV-2-2007]KTD43940.1 hypothetical protein Loak_0490 [Legionella oakridgensis]STY19655.1 Uncharacterised protein [Legionella longbeachae]
MDAYLKSIKKILTIMILFSGSTYALPLTPPEEPKADSFYICYEKRCPNNVIEGPIKRYTKYKYIGCIISRLPCHLHCGDKFNARATPLKQFQWVNNYPDALNSFYRCAYS